MKEMKEKWNGPRFLLKARPFFFNVMKARMMVFFRQWHRRTDTAPCSSSKFLLWLFLWLYWLIPFIFFSSNSFAVTSYLKDYNVGLNIIGQYEAAQITYDLDSSTTNVPANVINCGDDDGVVTRTCRVPVGISGGGGTGSSYIGGIGLFLQQPLKRKGLLYYNWDLAFDLRILSGEYASGDKQFYEETLESIEFSLYGLRMRPYVQLGLTPAKWPDLIFTFGTSVDTLAGSVAVNGESTDVFFVQTAGLKRSYLPWAQSYFELELVFLRFGDGALSWYRSGTFSSESSNAGNFYDGEVNGMSNFTASFSSYQSGFKLLLNWP